MNQIPNASFALKVKVRRWSKAVRIGLADCPYCQRSHVCISRSKTLLEEVAIARFAPTSATPRLCQSLLSFYRPFFVATPPPSFAVVEVNSRFNKLGRARMASNAQPSAN